ALLDSHDALRAQGAQGTADDGFVERSVLAQVLRRDARPTGQHDHDAGVVDAHTQSLAVQDRGRRSDPPADPTEQVRDKTVAMDHYTVLNQWAGASGARSHIDSRADWSSV